MEPLMKQITFPYYLFNLFSFCLKDPSRNVFFCRFNVHIRFILGNFTHKPVIFLIFIVDQKSDMMATECMIYHIVWRNICHTCISHHLYITSSAPLCASLYDTKACHIFCISHCLSHQCLSHDIVMNCCVVVVFVHSTFNAYCMSKNKMNCGNCFNQ